MNSETQAESRKPCRHQRLIRLSAVANDLGVDRSTIWRYRRRDWLLVLNVNGRLFVEPSELSRFISRARSGEFYRPPRQPSTRTFMGAS